LLFPHSKLIAITPPLTPKSKEITMKWANLLVCALGCAVLLTSGCETFGIIADGTLSADAIGSVRVVDGSPPTVAVACAAMLQRRGFEARMSGAGDDMVVESKTPAGLSFALQLHRVPNDMGREWTRVTMTWMDSSKDSKTHVQIMTDIDKQPGSKKAG
jgi:hypothetical protein